MSPGQRTGVAFAVVVLVGVAAAAIGVRGGADTAAPGRDEVGPSAQPGNQPGNPQTRRAVAAGAALAALERAVADQDRAAFTRVYSGDAAGQLFDTLAALPLAGWDLRYIAEETTEAGTWVGDVEARWSLADFDDREVGAEIDVTFAAGDADRARISSIEPGDDARTPEWLLGETQVRRGADTLVISARPDLTRRAVAQARQALRDVRAVVPESTDPVVVVVPAGTAQLEQLLGDDPGSYDSIAAVTSTVDGTSDPSAPVRVVLNPPVYRRLGGVGAQVVLSHEATHVATGAATTQVPLWLVEGFADYVALADRSVPVDVAASQILRQVRRDGPPRQLPSEDDFESTAGRLGASYEAAWLVCRMIAEQTDEETLLRFYQRALEDGDLESALRDVLGTDTERLTRQWRAYLGELA